MSIGKARVLVTTALEQAWPEHQPVLFLGEWCRRYDRKARWARMDSEVLPYHWDDRDKLFHDFKDLQALNERLLRELATELNRLHGENHSLRYWRIVLGFWLNLFTATVLDRWEMVRRAAATGSVMHSLRLSIPQSQLVANDTADFIERILGDIWNHSLYARLIEEWTDIPLEIVRQEIGADAAIEKPSHVGLHIRFNRKVFDNAARLLSKHTRPDECFFISTYLPFLDDFRLQWNLGQVPKVWVSPPVPRAKFDLSKRQWKLKSTNANCTFEQIVRTLLPDYLPTSFLEGYQDLSELVNRLPWPSRPRLIWTSNQHFSDDVFKSWAAGKTESGTAFVTGQHGTEATGLFNGTYAYQAEICDMHMTWSRDIVSSEREQPIGILKKLPHSKPAGTNGRALLVTTAMPQYSFDLRSTVVAGQMLTYFDEQFTFVHLLPAAIQRRLLVRIAANDYGWSQRQRWQDRFPWIQLDQGPQDIGKLIATARLVISSYNSTTYLESFSMSVPTVIYWNPRYWELRESAIPYFTELKRVGIFHETAESAARHVAAIWHDVDGWWASPAVQGVLESFRNRYCYRAPSTLARIANALREVKAFPERPFETN